MDSEISQETTIPPSHSLLNENNSWKTHEHQLQQHCSPNRVVDETKKGALD